MTEQTLKTGLGLLVKMYGTKLDSEMIAAYWNCLKHLSDNDFLRAQENILKTFVPTSQVPFPAIPHFLAAIGLSGQNRSKLAVEAVIKAAGRIGLYNSVSFGDPALHETIERFGGWPAVASWGEDEWKFQEKNFIQSYEATLSSGTAKKTKCIGITEQTNNDKILTGRQLEIAEKLNSVKLVQWTGFDEKTLKIENKTENKPKEIDFDFNNLVKSI